MNPYYILIAVTLFKFIQYLRRKKEKCVEVISHCNIISANMLVKGLKSIDKLFHDLIVIIIEFIRFLGYIL